MRKLGYLMENDDEIVRLEMKTDVAELRRQALWAGIRPGIRVADICCGPGLTASSLYDLVRPGGSVMGIDGSPERIEHARRNYGGHGIEFRCIDIRDPLTGLGDFDFVWVRFVLEYHRAEGFEIVENVSGLVKPGGVLCLIDLDYNCLSHFGLSERLERTLAALVRALEERADFDPYAGRKHYSYLYRLGYRDINVEVSAHHLIFGELKESDAYNWQKKVEVVSRKVGYGFDEYEGGYDEFLEEFKGFFSDPSRFTYTPLILVRGNKPFP